MEKIYGYKESDMTELAEFLRGRKNEPLTKTFEAFAQSSGKAKGTVRNLYYALAKLSASDKRFCDEHLGGKALKVNVIEEFDAREEAEMLKKVLTGVKDGKSVRKCIAEITDGDAKRALRYQNKYRSVLAKKPELVAKIVGEIKEETGETVNVGQKSDKLPEIPEFQFERLTREINGLVERISLKTRRENEYLKGKIEKREAENLRLSAILYGGKGNAVPFFSKNKSRDMLS